jgi:hypothetical protein
MKVIRFTTRRLQNEEWFNCGSEFKNLVETFGSNILGIQALYILFLPLLYTADKLLEILRKSSYTGGLVEADRKRDELFSGFCSAVMALQKLPVPAKNEAARHLYNLLRGYRSSILRVSYAKASSAIYNLLQDLRTDDYAPDVTLLGVTDWVTALKQAEEAFLEIYSKRQQESIKKYKGDLLNLRREADVLYTAMITNLDGQLLASGLGGDIIVDPESLDNAIHENGEKFDPTHHGNIPYNFVIAWNETAKKYRNLIAQRTARLHAGDDTTPGEDQPDGEEE